MTDNALVETIQSLTLREKALLCSGATAWTTKPIPAKNIPSLRMADGPHGVRYEDHTSAAKNKGYSRHATCFPPEVAIACSFSPNLARDVGAALARECQHFGVGVLLGPGVNIKRSPLGGRNFEYYSEDPLLAGEMAAGLIAGVQGEGVATSLKHFAVNNQEKNRMSISAVTDERALFDLYLKPFEIAIRKAAPATVMASYNRVDGEFACENRRLLTDILRLRFGFSGAVISDWGAINSRVSGIMAGLDIEMPASGGVNDWAILHAVETGALNEDALDAACWNILRLVFTYANKPQPSAPCNFKAHHTLAVDALCKSAVLLKNDGILPLKKNSKIAVLGEMARKPHYQGGGSSVINPLQLVSFCAAMDSANLPYTYAPGYQNITADDTLVAAAVQAAQNADTVLLFLGLPDVLECEGYDRESLHLPANQLQLLHAIAAANPNLCVVLCCGAPVEIPWLEKTRALLYPALGGEGVGEAVLRLVYGQQNPSGKLAESWPLALADTPAFHHFPMGPNEVTYNESLFCGYRYYDTAQKPVLFPFGHGLSYTHYAYSDLHINTDDTQNLPENQPLTAHFTLANTGERAGEEIVQLYLARKTSATFQPAHELKAFTRVALQPGESKCVTLTVPRQDLGFYDTATSSHIVEAGQYEIQIGASSRNLPLTATFQTTGLTLHRTNTNKTAETFYNNIQDNSFPANAFASLLKRPSAGNPPIEKGGYTAVTTLEQMQDSRWGRIVLSLATLIARKAIHFSNDPVASDHAARQLARDMPFKNVVLNTSGRVSPGAADALLGLCNGKGGFFRFVRLLFKKPPYRKKPPL